MMPRRILKWAGYQVGYRGVGAFILGLIWVLIGVSMLLDPSQVRLPDTIIPIWIRAVFWIGTGAYAIGWQLVTPFWKHDDHNVWFALMIMPAIRFFTYLFAAIIDAFHLFGLDYQTYWVGMFVWLAVVALVDVCALGLDRLPPLPPVREDDHA